MTFILLPYVAVTYNTFFFTFCVMRVARIVLGVVYTFTF